jgi:hypothetical protein
MRCECLATTITFTTGVPVVQLEEDRGFVESVVMICSLRLTRSHGPIEEIEDGGGRKLMNCLEMMCCRPQLTTFAPQALQTNPATKKHKGHRAIMKVEHLPLCAFCAFLWLI